MDETRRELQGYADQIQMPYNVQQYQQIQMMDGNVMQMPPPNRSQLPPPFSVNHQHHPHYLQSAPQQQMQPSTQNLVAVLEMFWCGQQQEIADTRDFKNHSLPLARVKKIMKADEDVRMIAAEAPVLFARACEMFILEMTLRSWAHTEESKRRTLQRNDIAAAISRTETFDFLIDIMPREEVTDEAASLAANAGVGGGGDTLPYFFVPPPSMIMGTQGLDQQQHVWPGEIQQQHFSGAQQHVWSEELQEQIEQPPQSQTEPLFPSDF